MPPTQTIIEGDCLAHMLTMASGSVAAIFTSPPYNFGKPYNVHNDRMPEADYLAWQGDVAKAIARILRPGGHLFLNVGSNSEFPARSADVMQVYRRHLVLQQEIIWAKSVLLTEQALPANLLTETELPKGLFAEGVSAKQAKAAIRALLVGQTIGHFLPTPGDYFLTATSESIWHFTLDGRSTIQRKAQGVGAPYTYPSQEDRFDERRQQRGEVKTGLRCAGRVWLLPYPTIQQQREHPSPFPVELAERGLRLAGLGTGDLVLDPFAGTGATLVAAQRLGLNAIGIEIDPKYCEAARRRLGQERPSIESSSPATRVLSAQTAAAPTPTGSIPTNPRG